ARLLVDVRVETAAEQDRVDRAVRALRPVTEGASLTFTGGPDRPPLPAGASAELFELAREQGAELGLGSLRGVAVGGASDGNLTAGAGAPTLDGLGAVGGGAHADDEHVIVAELPRRTALVARLVAALLHQSPAGTGGAAG
ncbi:M20/M25/M40 family metallo-hydrolase, partial [Streptomyces sp. NPDC002409]